MNPRPKVLYAEDEGLIAVLVEEALSEAGFEVLLARDGPEAIDLLDANHASLARLITDIRLGQDPDGGEIARRARARISSLPVIHTTGDSAHVWQSDGVAMSICIQKPFVVAQITTALAGLLGDATEQAGETAGP